mmetsp:Transcript_20992/g.24213  ORF Transcript_20992/g.24213 Transcript_20992/m.24213 type:complete len:83 (+) Transcript_20992:368-616(+)
MYGFLQYILEFGRPGNPKNIRNEVAFFIGIAYLKNKCKESMQMILAAGGLEIVVNFIDENFNENVDIIMIAIDICFSLLEFQ